MQSTPYYCEENVWRLCAEPSIVGQPRAALIISNAARRVAVNYQRAGSVPDSPIVWDYHVVLAVCGEAGWEIWDVDCTLGMPLPLDEYLRRSFGLPEGFGEALAPYFRVVEAQEYRATLNTDRRHMRSDSGEYLAPPPTWPTIGEGSNLMRLVDLEDDIVGTVVDLDGVAGALGRLAARSAPRT